MNKIIIIFKNILNPIIDLFLHICSRVFPTTAIMLRYARTFKRMPNLKVPQTFNEKLLKRIIYDRNPAFTLIADKFRVRDFIASRLGGIQYLTRIYAVVDNPNKIRDLSLPGKFVMKPNHLSNAIKIVYDSNEVSHKQLERLASQWLRRNHYNACNEWAYKDIQPLIIFEELLEIGQQIPDDYKIFCFNGEPRFLQINRDRFIKLQINFYDLNLSLLPVRLGKYENFQDSIVAPQNFDKMLEIARKLSAGFDFIRVDLYNLSGRIVFGELTNYPNAGLERFEPSSWDAKFGIYWK